MRMNKNSFVDLTVYIYKRCLEKQVYLLHYLDKCTLSFVLTIIAT